MEFVQETSVRHYNAAGEVDAEITYTLEEEGVIAWPLFVDPSLRGQGVARQLVERLAVYAREENLKVRPICSYVVELFKKVLTTTISKYKSFI